MQDVDYVSITPTICANSYHLVISSILIFGRGLKPGQATLDAIGGAHKFQSWPHNILTGA